MINQCPNCDKIINNNLKICECGAPINFHLKLVKKRMICSINEPNCLSSASFPAKDKNGLNVLYCEKHYDQFRTKSSIEVEMDKRIMAMKQKLDSTPGWPKSIKKLISFK